MSKASVVIVGGGLSGAAVARELSKKLDKSKHNLIVINPRPFDIWLPALVRAVVTGENGMDEVDKGAFTSYGALATPPVVLFEFD
jgi:NADH dehydrogenase FAD-containing subunit